MGVNVYLQTTDDRDHPAWDWFRQPGDRQFWDDFPSAEFESWTPAGFPWEDDRTLWRPKDFARFRAAADRSSNPPRWRHAADLMEAEPEFWLYFVY